MVGNARAGHASRRTRAGSPPYHGPSVPGGCAHAVAHGDANSNSQPVWDFAGANGHPDAAHAHGDGHVITIFGWVMYAILLYVILIYARDGYRRVIARQRPHQNEVTVTEVCGIAELEREAFRPMSEVIATAEARAEHEHRKAYGAPVSGGGGHPLFRPLPEIVAEAEAAAERYGAPVSGGGGIYPGPAGPFGVIAAWGPGDRQPDDIEVTAVGDSERKFIPGPGSTLENLRHRRLQVWEQAKRLATHAAAMERTFYPHEQVLWDRLNDEMDVLDKRIRHMLDLQGRVAARQFQVDELAARRARKRLDGPPGR